MLILIIFLFKGEGEPRSARPAGENRMAAVLRDSALPVQTHSAEELLQAAVCLYRRGEAARNGSGGGGAAGELQSGLFRGGGDGGDGRRC